MRGLQIRMIDAVLWILGKHEEAECTHSVPTQDRSRDSKLNKELAVSCWVQTTRKVNWGGRWVNENHTPVRQETLVTQ